MKKFFSLFAAILFAGSMMAEPIVINASDVTTIASGATSGLDVTLQGINIVWQGAYYNTDGSDGGSASVDFRVYAGKSMTLTAESNISKVEIAGYCKAGLTVTANAGTITTGASYASETTKRTLEDPLIVVDEIGATSVTLNCTKQMRAYTIRVTLGEGGNVEPTMDYYVAGSMTNWGPMAAYKLAANPAVEGEYMGEFTFAANDEFKVGYSDGTTIESTNYFPTGMDNNYVITEAGDYTVYFRPDGQGGEDWHYGCIKAIKKEAPIVHQYEVAEAIAAGLQENDEVLVRGVITKMEFKGANFAKFGSVNIYVADATDAEGEFEFFNCYSLNADTFRTSIPNYDPTDKTWAQFNEVADENGNTIHVGDTVIAFGKYKLYNSTHELNTGCYLVDIKHAPVAPAETITIDIESEVQYVDYVAEEGWWQFMAENDEYEISISNLSTTQAAGTYTVADLDAKFSYVFRKADSLSIAFVEGSFELTEGEDGSRTIEGVMTGDDGNIYNIKLVFVIPTAETTVNVEIPEWEVYNSAELYGFASYLFAGEAADGTYVQIVIPGSNPLGTFTYDDCYTGGTGIQVGDEYKAIYSMNITINVSDAQRAIITADILCLNNTLYHVTTHIGEGINNVEDAVKAIKRIVNGQVVIEKAGKTYNMNGAVIR